METMMGRFLETLGRNSIEAGVLVVVVLVAQWIFGKRIAPRWRCALWLLVMARLLLPVSPGSMVSLFNLFPRLGTTPPEMTSRPAPQEARPSVVQNTLVEPIANPAPREAPPAVAHNLSSAIESPIPPLPTNPKTETKTAITTIPAKFPWPTILFAFWFAGFAFFAGYVLLSSIRLHRQFAKLKPATDASLLALLGDCRERLGVRSELSLSESPDIATPALYGFLKPKLLLPRGFTGRFSAKELRFILLHELAHVKRRDILFNWLAAILQILHWFNPLIWFGFARWRADRELACDALALETAGAKQNKEYGQTILRLLENFTHRAALPGLVGILEDKRQLQRRIRMIAGFRPGKGFGLVSAVLFASLGLVCLTDAQLPKARENPKAAAGGTATETSAQQVSRHGADPVPTANGTNMPTQTLTVTVLDTATGQPLPDAEVDAPYTGSLLDTQPHRLTDRQGKYVVQIMPVPKEYRRQRSVFLVSARHESYASRSTGWTSSAGDVEATMPKEVTIRLERGITLGGAVQDERGQPLAGIRVLLSGSDYRGFSMGTDQKKTHDFPEIGLTDKAHPAATTDANGRWKFAHFPSDLETVTVTFVRPDDSRYNYVTVPERGLNQYPQIPMKELRATNAVIVLPDGFTVRGLVTDEAGRPMAGATVKEGYGHANLVQVSEFKTDRAGRFERLNRVPRQWIYTATADGRATMSVVAQVESNMPEVRLVLPSARPLIIHVTDGAGKPVAGVKLRIHPNRNDGQLLDWKGNTDAKGLAVWTNAPLTPVTFYAAADSPASSKEFEASAADGEKTVVLGGNAVQKATVKIRAFDAKTQAPVTIRSVAVEYNGNFTPKTVSEPNVASASIEIRATDFQVGMSPGYKVQLNAEGYDPFVTDFVDLEKGDQNLAAAMVRGETADGIALQPDGKPAVGARIWVRPTQNSGNVFANAPGRYYGDRLARTNTDENGRFVLPPVQGNQPVVLVSSNGFLETTVEEIKHTHRAQLQAWGRVEGVLKIAGKPKGGMTISLAGLQWSPDAGFSLSYLGSTAPDGSFSFDQVPAGEYKLYCTPRLRTGRSIPADHQMPIIVKAGETTKVDYRSPGRAVIGQAVSDKSDLAVDWQNDDDTLTLKQAPIPEPNFEDFASQKAFQDFRNHFYRSPQMLEQARSARTYVLEFEQDGSFRADDIPPGTYELKLKVTKADANSRSPISTDSADELGSVTHEVVVPPGSGPFDLGTLIVPMKGGGGGTTKSSPANFTATRLDGTPVSLAQFKGKYVVLAFWALWSDRSAEELKEVQKLQAGLSGDSRVTFVSISLDGKTDAVGKEIAARGYPWTQATADATNLATITAVFNVNSLPAVYLIDPDGRIVARDLAGERLTASVQRALQKK